MESNVCKGQHINYSCILCSAIISVPIDTNNYTYGTTLPLLKSTMICQWCIDSLNDVIKMRKDIKNM